MSKQTELRILKEQIERKRHQPIYSGEEAKKLREAEKLLSEAAEMAGEERAANGKSLRLYQDEYVAELYGEDLGLTLTEFEMLSTLKRHSPKAYTRQQLIEKVFISGDEENILATERTVDAHVRNLREKLGVHSDCIETVRGVGYRYTDEPFGET
jgi:DNA-binding response OmpR family regulator